jgi:hypothetical protein
VRLYVFVGYLRLARADSESESYVTTDGQSASLSWYKAPIWGLRPDFYCRTEYRIRRTVANLLIWGALSDERAGLSFTIASGPSRHSHSRVRVPLRLATIFYCLRFETLSLSISGSGLSLESYVTTDGQSASLSWYKAPIRGLRPDFYFRTEYRICLTVTFLIPWGALSDETTGLSFVCAAGLCQRSLSRVLIPWNLDRILLSQI